jgi:polyisoprenoid-binding protein YceI
MKILFSTLFFYSILFSTDYKIENSKVTYYGDHYLHKWEGSTTNVNGAVQYDKTRNQYNCTVVIPLSAFSSGNDSRDSNMLIYCKAFDFPSINFESKFIYVNKKSLEIEGVVDFAGKKKELKTTAQLNVLQDNKFSIQGEFEIMLSDFDIKRPSFLFVKIEDSILIKYSIKGVVNE